MPDQEIQDVEHIGGPHDGALDSALISDGELCDKMYFSHMMDSHCHIYSLTYNNDDGYRFIYAGVKAFTVDENGDYEVEE